MLTHSRMGWWLWPAAAFLPFLFAAAFTTIPSDPEEWVIDEKIAFTQDGRPINPHILALLEALEAKDGIGDAVSREDFLELLRRPEAREVYADQILRYASPRSIEIQEQDHEHYTRVYMKEDRIQAGVQFWKDYEDLLSKAERVYGVPAKDIVAILMWESGLGEFTGDFRVFNVYMGQLLFLDAARDHAAKKMRGGVATDTTETATETLIEAERLERIKSRAAKNLASLIRHCRAAGSDPLAQRGSWGGAIGFPQFLPSSMVYAIDGDGDGTIDLSSWPDAIHSVANYLSVAGRYGTTDERRRKAILSYNRSEAYVNGVITYAEAVAARR